VGRRGKKKALVAVGHQILVSAFFILRNLEPYKEPVLHDNPKRRNRKIKNYLAKLRELGVRIEIPAFEETKKVDSLLENQF